MQIICSSMVLSKSKSIFLDLRLPNSNPTLTLSVSVLLWAKTAICVNVCAAIKLDGWWSSSGSWLVVSSG